MKKKSLIIFNGTDKPVKFTQEKINVGCIPKGKIVKVYKKRLPIWRKFNETP